MVDFRKFCPIFILAIFMQAPIVKEAKDSNKNNKKKNKSNGPKNNQSISKSFMSILKE